MTRGVAESKIAMKLMARGRGYLSSCLPGFDAFLNKQIASPMTWLLHKLDLGTARIVMRNTNDDSYETSRAWTYQYRAYMDFLLKALQVSVY